ncbi:ATP-grasp domain-containing protein [Pseudoxanthomonas koreensis]|uniref:ATP-grasp domain-containing protein n=1 Tax=Pseudoxanthomonas koreensis TaxID=266061 RepID=UPI0035A6E6C2
MNVLVFPCGSEIGLEIHAALRHAKDIRLHGVSSVPDHGEFVYARYRHIGADARSPALIDELNALIDEWAIDLVLPAHDSVIPVLAMASRLHCAAAVPGPDIAATCRDKRLTYVRLAHLGIVPATIDGLADGYPIFAKPAVGQGSQGAERVDDSDRHRYLLENARDYLFSEYLPGAEYTVDCISDATGTLLDAAPRTRERVKSGISVRTAPAAATPGVGAMAKAIAAELALKGAWFFQVRMDRHGVPKLLEVAPRIAGSMALSRMRGINYPLLHVYAHLGKPFSVLAQGHAVVMDRALCNRYRTSLSYARVYLDLDDTLVIDGAVNPLLMALLYQWHARGTAVVLLTRHAGQPLECLARHRICPDLFERIVHLQDRSPKSAAIGGDRDAIFIDDSYRERRDVHMACGIPVFDLDAVEQLLELRA